MEATRFGAVKMVGPNRVRDIGGSCGRYAGKSRSSRAMVCASLDVCDGETLLFDLVRRCFNFCCMLAFHLFAMPVFCRPG